MESGRGTNYCAKGEGRGGARIAKEKADEEAALEACRLAEEKEVAEQRERENKVEAECWAKQEIERLERERKEEERKVREEEERIKLELEEVERKAEEERVAAQKPEEEEDARIATEIAEEETALDASRLAEEEEEAKAKEAMAMEESVVIPTPADATSAVLEEDEVIEVDEQIPSLGKTQPPIATTSDNPVIDGHQLASLKTASFIKEDDFLSTKYPNDVTSPDPSINANFGSKGFHYDMDFLLQFKDICKDKPRDDWDSIIKDTMGDSEEQNPRPVDTTRVSSLQPMGEFIIENRPPPALPRQSPGPTTSPSSQGRRWSEPQRDRGNRRRRQPPPPPPSLPCLLHNSP